jgi:hypothetical protein
MCRPYPDAHEQHVRRPAACTTYLLLAVLRARGFSMLQNHSVNAGPCRAQELAAHDQLLHAPTDVYQKPRMLASGSKSSCEMQV